MNFVLKDNAEGGSLTARHGEYYEGDWRFYRKFQAILPAITKRRAFANLSFQDKKR